MDRLGLKTHRLRIFLLVTAVAALGATALGVATVYASSHRGGIANVVRRAGSALKTRRADAAPRTTSSAVSSDVSHIGTLMAQSATGSPGAFDSTVMPAQESTAGIDGDVSTDTAVAGLEGPAGADGVDGVDGAEGPQGPRGARGARGSVGATGLAGVGLAQVTDDGGGLQLSSPDGVSYRIVVTDSGIWLHSPSSVQLWSQTAQFQSQLR